MLTKNTINICIGHKPFPNGFESYYDIYLSRNPVDNPGDVIVVEHNFTYQQADSLGEFVQFLWLEANPKVIEGYDFIRIFHRSRFTSLRDIGISSDYGWIRILNESELLYCAEDFSRQSKEEIFNKKYEIGKLHKMELLTQYASSHVLSDIINFTKYLHNRNIFDKDECYDFLFSETIIPACTVGVFKMETFKYLLTCIREASAFMLTNYFVFREGFQSRNMAFILERYIGYLILKRVKLGESAGNFGNCMVFTRRYYE